MKFGKYFVRRLITCLLTIWIGVTFVFFIPRMFPSDPVENMIGQITARSGSMDPQEMEALRKSLRMQFGMEGSLWEQYTSYLWNGLLHFDFGPSLMSYPVPVGEIVARYLPYTVGLSLTTTFSMAFRNFIGLRAGFQKEKTSSKVLEGIAIFIYPIPYFIIALILQIVFSFVLKWFPLMSTIRTTGTRAEYLRSLLTATTLPAVSLLLSGLGWWIISMKSLSATTAEEDFVQFSRFRGLPENTIGKKYVFKNSILPQITALGLSLGGAFSGSIMTEIIFGYPGIGNIIQKAILQSDYNMIMGTITISIVAVSVATFVVDLLNPLIDPRIRYS